MTTNLLVLGCKWVGAIPLPPLCTSPGTSWGDLYLYGISKAIIRQHRLLDVVGHTLQKKCTISLRHLKVHMWICYYVALKSTDDNFMLSEVFL